MAKTKEAAAEAPAEEKDKLSVYIEEQASKLVINDVNLNEEFMYQAQHSVRANIKASQAAALLTQVKTELDETISMIDSEIRTQADEEPTEKEGKKKSKPTEAMILNLIKLDPRYKVVKDKLNKAERQASIYKDIARAWEHKKDMLIQMGSMTRAEMDATIRIKNRQTDDEDLSPTARKGNGNSKYPRI